MIAVGIELIDIIIGDEEYLLYTLEMKYADSAITMENIKPKNMLKM